VNRQQLIDELTAIVAIEHALIVDNLQISYALGTHREDVVTPLGPASPEGREAAGEARVEGWLSHDELMFDLSGRAGETMTALDDFNAVLVGRGLIAPFHL
jgi:hypothetical protein